MHDKIIHRWLIEHHKPLSDAVSADHRAVDLCGSIRRGRTHFLSVLTAQRTQYADESALTQSTQNIATDLIAL